MRRPQSKCRPSATPTVPTRAGLLALIRLIRAEVRDHRNVLADAISAAQTLRVARVSLFGDVARALHATTEDLDEVFRVLDRELSRREEMPARLVNSIDALVAELQRVRAANA